MTASTLDHLTQRLRPAPDVLDLLRGSPAEWDHDADWFASWIQAAHDDGPMLEAA